MIKRGLRRVLKKSITIVVLIVLLFNILPLYQDSTYAFDADRFKVDSVTIFKVYDVNRNLQQRRILIMGSSLKDAEVGIVTSEGYAEFTDRTVNSQGILQFDVKGNELGNAIVVEGVTIPVDEGEMPTLSGVPNKKIKAGIDDLILQGTNLNKVTQSEITAGYEREGAFTYMPEAPFADSDTIVTIPSPSGILGLQNIIFQKNNIVEDFYFNDAYPAVDVSVTIKYTYKDQFKLVQDLAVTGLEMYPNRGEKGDTVYFETVAPNHLDNYDVFFIKDINGTDPYTNSNKGKNKTFRQGVGGKDILTVEVPDIGTGDYYIVLTNPVTEGNDPMDEVVQEMVVADKFSVIQSNIKTRIKDVQPNTGPDAGSETTILGQFIVSMNIPEFISNVPGYPNNVAITSTNPEELVIDYGSGTYKGIPVSNVQRKVKIFIGQPSSFVKDDEGKCQVVFSDALDRITVRTPKVTDADTNPVKDVIVETETTFINGSVPVVTIKERAEMKNGYTYIPGTVSPVINNVTPNLIQVVGPDEDGNYTIMQDTMVAIHGSNFMIHRYIDKDGREVVRYPIVEFGSEIGLNKNSKVNPGDPPSNTSLNIKVFDGTGKELDGSDGNEIGERILVVIPAGSKVKNLGKTFVRVSNPTRNSENTGMPGLKIDSVEFVNPDASKQPVITAVSPSVVTTEGGEPIAIEGSNFAQGVKIFIDGEEITSIVRQGDGKKITLTSPKGREGYTYLVVMNPEGAAASWPFTYVKTYTNPKITEFTPKSGNTGTLMIIKGENFLKPDPAASMFNQMRLIGTRVLLEGVDVNKYNLNAYTKAIEMRDYKSPLTYNGQNYQILSIETNSAGDKYLKIADYYSAIILQEMNNMSFYTLDVDVKGNILLSNGSGDNYTLKLSPDGTRIIAEKDGEISRTVIVDESDPDFSVIRLDDNDPDTQDIFLKLRTFYKVESINGSEIITGKNARVVDSGLIYVTIPVLDADGYYDVIVENPDTKKDSRINQQGFYYYSQPLSMPQISDIFPKQGSTEGGYFIVISGHDFEDNGNEKSRVFINGVEVAPENVSVAVDGTSITVKVPPYSGDLMQDKGTNRLDVPVVVLNTDGASASDESGFTYVIPVSHPKITRITPQKGRASGGDTVEIFGTDFRFFEPFEDANRNQVRDEGEEFNNINRNKDGSGKEKWDSEAEMLDKSNTELRGLTPLEGHPLYNSYYTSPILPKVYFGGKEAKIVEFARGYIKVIAPEGIEGNNEVYLVNNDSGISNKTTFTYVVSKPGIKSITPAQGKKQGGEPVEILGTDFIESAIDIYRSVTGDVYDVYEKTNIPLVRFGRISNREIPREEENSGRIDNGRATVNLEGSLRISYDAVEGTLDISITERNTTYSAEINGYNGAVRYIPVSLLESNDSSYSGYELIRVEVYDRRLLVDRGYSPRVEYLSSGQLIVYTPSYYTIGVVPVTVINPDGGKTEGKFEYKNPASNPVILNIAKESQLPQVENIDGRDVAILRVNYKGGNLITITGQDFLPGASVQISDALTIEEDEITYDLPGKLNFRMPAVSNSVLGRLCRVSVINEDGGIAASDKLTPPIYIIFTKGESSPSVEGISPEYGPANGGTEVKITGRDFRERMDGYDGRISVYFGSIRVPDEVVTVADYNTIYVTAPANAPGEVEVRVENPDGELSSEGIVYTYLSIPEIANVVDPEDPQENTRIKVISIEGGQEIKLKGTGFMEGAIVLFNPVVRLAGDDARNGDNIIYIKGIPYILEDGREGSNVRVIDSETVCVVTPQGKLDASGVIVVNPDKGASEIYTGLKYGYPELDAPTGVVAELVFDRYITINWKPVEGAIEYEVFVVIDRNETELVGITDLTAYMYTDLERNTRYKFVVRAVGNYGSSKPSLESNTVKTGSKAGPPDNDGGLNKETQMTRAGDVANIVVGERNSDDNIIINLNSGVLAGCKDVVISIPAAVATSSRAGNITIIGSNFRIEFNPNAFNTAKLREYKNKDDAGVKFMLTRYNGSLDIKNPGKGESSLSSQYKLEASIFTGRDSTVMDYLASSIRITMDYDISKADMRKLNKIALCRYDGYTNGWQSIGNAVPGNALISAVTNRLGIYSVIGRRQ